jgi:hypothetical protein
LASQTLHDRKFPNGKHLGEGCVVGNIYLEGGNKPPCKKEISSSRKDAETKS